MPNDSHPHVIRKKQQPDLLATDDESSEKSLSITSSLKIPAHSIRFSFSHASGPGGQHVNTADSAVLLRFDINSCASLSDEARGKLMLIAGRKINAKGELLLAASESRSQLMNKRQALKNLQEILREAVKKPKQRRDTAVPKHSKEKRLQEKKRHAEKLFRRQLPPLDS